MEEKLLSAEEIYRGILKDENRTVYLSSFVNQAEKYNSKASDVDIVKQYLRMSGNGREILQLVKFMPTVDSQIVLLIMKTLCHILLRVANDLNAFTSVGISIANEVLASGMRSIFNFLKLHKQSSSRKKVALHLLSCMVALGEQTAHKVVTKLDFSNATFNHLLHRGNLSVEEDTRTAFINFIILIMTTCDYSVICQLVEIKGFLNDILRGLLSDRPHIISLVLSTFRRMIVQNGVISKTAKLKLFNDHSLKPVVKLYTWKGPVQKKAFKRKLGAEEQTVAYNASEEEINDVHAQAHEFMMSLCCSFKTGIIFYDSSFGSSGQNKNHVLTNILAYMPKPHTVKLVADFMTAVLKTCPDQMVYYLPCMKGSCTPRPSTLWADAIGVIKKIILAQDPIACLFKPDEKKPVSVLINIAKSLCFPNVVPPTTISQAFKDGHPFICFHLCDYLICILDKVRSVTEFCIQADATKTLYSSADLSAFSQCFLTSIFQNFSFMQELEDFWEKQTSSTCKKLPHENKEADLTLPSVFDQLSKILEVMEHFLSASHHGYHAYEVNVPKLFQSLKNSHSFLSHEEICSLNLKIIDIISVQGEKTVLLWNKNLIDSPLMVLLDLYMTASSENMMENVSQILYKVLIHTKIFDFCPWETNIWLESLKSSKAKYVPFIVEYLNNTVCFLLQNPNLFSDHIIESTFGKSNLHRSLDVTSMLNDLLSTEKDPILIKNNNFEKSSCSTSVPNLSFSPLVLAALRGLNEVEDHKRKGCQLFLEKVLYHTMHHQQSPEVLFSVVQKYKDCLSDNLIDYFELLCPSRYQPKAHVKSEDASVVCKTDLSEHLKTKFIALHNLQNSFQNCQCDILCEPQELEYQYREKVIWQLMAYLDWEIKLFLEDKIQSNNILIYIKMLEKLLNSLDEICMPDEIIKDGQSNRSSYVKYNLLLDVLNRSCVSKVFLWIDTVQKSKRSLMKECVGSMTKLVLKLIAKVVACDKSHEYILQFRDKVVKFNSYYFETVNLPKNIVMLENPDIYEIIHTFSPIFSSSEITFMLEELLNMETKDVKPENYFSTFTLIFKMYIELEDFILLSPKAMNSLFIKFSASVKKQKKVIKECMKEMFEKHPVLASVVNVDCCQLLLKQPASKNFYILGFMIDCNNKLRQVIQSEVLESLEELKDSPDFIYLVSKCILNSRVDEDQDISFISNIAPLFWEKVSSHIIIDVVSPDMLLENSDSGKAVQVLCAQNALAAKKIRKFFKTHVESLTSTIPSSSKMHILLQFMEVLKTSAQESAKSTMLILKLSIRWLTEIISSFQGVSEFNYLPLINFTQNLLKTVNQLNITDFIQVEPFFQKILKVAMKHRDIGHQLIEILTLLCQKSQNSDIPTQLLFNLVTGHSNFFNIMLSQIQENECCKESIIDLLITFVSRDKSVCQENHLGLILSSYSGSLKSVDRKLLFLIKLYSESDVDVAKFSPFLWGKTAVVHYSVMNSGSVNLWTKPKLQDLLSIFSLEMLQTTVEKYPLTLTLEPSISEVCGEFDGLNLDKIYDLRFFLPLLANLLSPGSFVHCRSFMDSTVLMLIFTSLSSIDAKTRALGYYCLSQLYFHLEGANYGEKEIWLSLLDSLRNSITSENPRIPSIISLFLAKVTFIFTKPDHPFYSALCNFIMVKPNLDIGQVPEFYKLFNSLEIEHKKHRMWLLKLLSDGLRSSLDFHICQKRYIFSLIMTHYWSSVSCPEEKSEILNVISAAAKIDVPARLLSENAILSWLHNVVESNEATDLTIIYNLSTLLKNLWFTCKKFCCNKSSEDSETTTEEGETQKISLYASFPYEFQIVLLSFLKKAKFLNMSSLKLYLSTLHDVLVFVRSCSFSAERNFNFSVNHISEILECWHSVIEREKSEMNGPTQKYPLFNSSGYQQLYESFSKIISLWSPDWKSDNEECDHEQELCLKSVHFMLKYLDIASAHASNLPKWLHKCMKEDQNHGFVKLLLSPRGESCLKLMLDVYEKSLNVRNQLSDCTTLCSEPRNSSCLEWHKILLHLKKVCKSCNLTPDLNIYHQITLVL